MRWTKKYLEHGERRIIRTYLLLPKSIDGEVRWLESANILQQFTYTLGWSDIEFIDDGHDDQWLIQKLSKTA
jgi:hypothetical protein